MLGSLGFRFGTRVARSEGMTGYQAVLDHWTHREVIKVTSEHQARSIIDRHMAKGPPGSWARAVLRDANGRPLRLFKRYPRA